MMWFVREEFFLGSAQFKGSNHLSFSLTLFSRFRDQGPAPFSIQLLPASDGKGSLVMLKGFGGGPRQNHAITFQMQLRNARVMIVSTKKPIHRCVAENVTRLMRVKSNVAQIPYVVVAGKLREGSAGTATVLVS
ncbi:hypothetical protein TNCV_3015361 [Trichonephila clavipes]|nr:hypothetical protein TNCV_3015361 [Trichonephila clavipes]